MRGNTKREYSHSRPKLAEIRCLSFLTRLSADFSCPASTQRMPSERAINVHLRHVTTHPAPVLNWLHQYSADCTSTQLTAPVLSWQHQCSTNCTSTQLTAPVLSWLHQYSADCTKLNWQHQYSTDSTSTQLTAPVLSWQHQYSTDCTSTQLTAPVLNWLHQYSTDSTSTQLTAPVLNWLHQYWTHCTSTQLTAPVLNSLQMTQQTSSNWSTADSSHQKRQKTALPPQVAGSFTFARWRQCALPLPSFH